MLILQKKPHVYDKLAFVRLLNYFSASMIVLPLVLIILTFLDYLDKNVLHNPFGWAPILAVMGVICLYIFYQTSRVIEAGAGAVD